MQSSAPRREIFVIRTSLTMDLKKVLIFSSICASLICFAAANENSTEPLDPNQVEAEVRLVRLPDDFILKKCNCKASQELQGSECVDTETFITVVEYGLGIGDIFNTERFPNITVGGFECPHGRMIGTFENNADLLYLLTDGALLWQHANKVFQNYCVENIPGGWMAKVCLEPPLVPRCCPAGYTMGPGNCTRSPLADSFAPPMVLSDQILNTVEIDNDYVNEVNCSGIEVERHIALGNEDVFLQYAPTQASLLYKSPYLDFGLQAQENYCVGVTESGGDLQYVAKFCYTDPKKLHHHLCKNSTCVRKCCHARQFLLGGECVDLGNDEEAWQPVFHERDSLKPGADAPEDLLVVSGPPMCTSNLIVLKYQEIETDKAYLLSDGTLHWPHQKDYIAPDSYCIDSLMEDDGSMREEIMICGAEDVVCEWKGILTSILFIISCVFLIGTLAVYIGVAELRDRTNGRCLISLVVAMLAAFISIIANHDEDSPSDLQCLLKAFFGHVFLLAMFFWLNVMCFDMWSTLRSSQQQHQSKKTFIKYSVYAWGVPIIIGIITIVLDLVQPENVILPNFLEYKNCWFRGNAEYWLYLSGFILVLMTANLFFFIHVAITLAQKLQQRQSVFNNTNSRSSNSAKAKKQAWLYIKLFVVMGVAWIADFIASATARNECSFWIIFEIINGLQGVFIFLVAVCNKDNMKKFRNAWNPRVESIRTKISTMKSKSSMTKQKKMDASLSTPVSSRKTSTTSLPHKICAISDPQALMNLNLRKSDSPPPKMIPETLNQETVPMNHLEE